MKTKYRIVTDTYAGYEVQRKLWWFPFYLQFPRCNTHCSLLDALDYLRKHRNMQAGHVVWEDEK